MLHPAVGTNRYCGPAALAIILGCDTGEAARRLRVSSGERAIKGIGDGHMRAVLKQAGLHAIPKTVNPYVPRNLGQQVKTWGDGIFLVVVTKHYVVVHVGHDGVEVCDNRTIHPLPLERSKRLSRKHVKKVWRLI